MFSEIANPHAIQKQDTEIIVNAEAKNIVSPKKAHKQMLLDTNIAQESPPPKTPESEKAKAKIFVLSSPSEISEEVLINLPAAIRVEMYEAFIAQKKKAKGETYIFSIVYFGISSSSVTCGTVYSIEYHTR